MRRKDQQLRCPRCGKSGYGQPTTRGYWRRYALAEFKKRLMDMTLNAKIVEPWPSGMGDPALQAVVERVSSKTGFKFLVRPTLRGLSVRRVS